MSDDGAFDLSLSAGRTGAGPGPLVTQASLLQNMEYLSRMGLSLPLAAQNKVWHSCRVQYCSREELYIQLEEVTVCACGRRRAAA